MHRQRVAVALVGVPLLLLVVFWAPPVVFGLLVTAAAVAVQAEFYRLAGDRLSGPDRRHGLLAGGLTGLAATYPGLAGPPEAAVLAAAAAALTLLLLRALFAPAGPAGATERVALLFLGVAYGPVLLAHLTLLRRLLPDGEGAAWVTLALAAVWGGDSAAYYVGRRWGRRRLYAAVSPGKTWEGAAAGAVGTLLAMGAVKALLLPELPAGRLLALGLVAAAAGQLGDLCESLLKRDAGVKDTGRILPGHGGLLDRLDSLLFVAPVIYYYARAAAAP